MFFRIHADSKTAVTGVVGCDFQVYWIAGDVARLLARRREPCTSAKHRFCRRLDDVLPRAWNLPTFGYNRTLRLFSHEKVEKLCTLHGQAHHERSPAYRFAAWILREADYDGRESPRPEGFGGYAEAPAVVPLFGGDDGFVQFLQAPLLAARLRILPQFKIVARGGAYTFRSLQLLLVGAAAKVFRKWHRLEGWRVSRIASKTRMVQPSSSRGIRYLDESEEEEDECNDRRSVQSEEEGTSSVHQTDVPQGMDDDSAAGVQQSLFFGDDDERATERSNGGRKECDSEVPVGDLLDEAAGSSSPRKEDHRRPDSTDDEWTKPDLVIHLDPEIKNTTLLNLHCYQSVATSTIVTPDGRSCLVPDSFVAWGRDLGLLYVLQKDVVV